MKTPYLWAPLCATGLLLAACSDDNDDDNGGGANQPQTLYLSNDQGGNLGSVERFDSTTRAAFGLDMPTHTFNAGLSEGIALDATGSLYQAGVDGSANGSIRVACTLPARSNSDGFTPGTDRVLNSGLAAPKGIAIAADAGLVIAAEPGGTPNAISVHSSTAGDGSAALFTVSGTLVGGAGAWDVAYDETTDRLFAALVNGTIAYIPDFVANSGSSTISIFQPDNPLATASNMHGIDYDASADRLVVSDVAVASGGNFDTDGSLYVFNNASTLSGSVTPDRTIRGPSTLLGNPVDLKLAGPDVIVAEKSNAGGQLLRFQNIANGPDGDIAPDLVEATSNPPESLALTPEPFVVADDSSDLSGTAAQRIFVTSNPAAGGTQVLEVSTDFSTSSTLFSPVIAGQFVESIALDQNGDAVVSFDDGMSPGAGGLSFINRLGLRSTGTAYTPDRDRQIVGMAGLLGPTDNTTLVSPKGFDVVGSRGVVIVADLNAAAPGALKVFSLCANGNVAPLATTTLPSGVRAWDLDYDPDNDRLYAAGVDGTVLVYDDYLDGNPGAATPDRTIDPNDQSGFADSNLHGIVHVAGSDQLIISDVGSATNADDGRIYVINNAATAEGLTNLRLEIAFTNSMLGNPVDLAFDGNDLYVAEKSNDVVMRYDNILSLTSTGAQDIAPDASVTVTKPESIALSP